MNTKNEVFEYLIDQLRQQVTKKDVISFDVSVRISDLDDVKQVIHNLQQHIAGKDDEIRALKDSLRQQVNNNQCEDLAHEVLSLKNQLRDASAQIKELHLGLGKATGGVEDYKLIRKGKFAPEQSGCRKEDAQECHHEFVHSKHKSGLVCFKCGVRKECEHEWQFYGVGFPCMCIKCGLKK